MCKKNNDAPKPLIIQGSEFDFWLNEEDSIYDEKYGEKTEEKTV